MMGKEKVILKPISFPEKRNGIAGNKFLSAAEGRNIRHYFILFQGRFPRSLRDTWREPGVGRGSDALGLSSAAELGWAPGTEGAHDKWASLHRGGSAQEQLLCKAQQS